MISVIEVERAHFLGPSRTRALRVEPEQAQACEKYHQACLEPDLLTYKNWKLQARVYFELFLNKPRAYLLRAHNLARAFEPEHRLIPPPLNN